ncbi:MAG TPA: HNH endonuclease signature motif containing protein [Actinomycetes bacterium]|nr:HNH endonuclease signature motif containing protein [Actinomycetes bacterium]
MVRGTASFYDGDLLYWARRLGRHPELPPSKASLLKRQQGRCAWCGLLFRDLDDLMESDHRLPRSCNGADAPHNRQLLHGHCHDQKTAKNDLLPRRQYPPREATGSGSAGPQVPTASAGRVRGAQDKGHPSRSRVNQKAHAQF